MRRVRYDGREFDLVERPLFAELAWVEDQSGVSFEDMGGIRRTVALTVLSMRRAGVMVTWSDIFDHASPNDLEIVQDQPDLAGEAADPTPAGAEAGESQPVASPVFESGTTGTGS